ncbi:TPA: DUF1016 domain-containing protein [Candidatus Bathyarchaeota archaeon]|nr:DUF1016 domain-containing protein [Candidatus Bathyarchaeota archaeon]
MGDKAVQSDTGVLVAELRKMIDEARSAVAVAVNAGLTLLYWRVGKRIYEDVLKQARANYGEELVSTVSRELTGAYGKGFSEKSLRHMIRFAEAFPDTEIVSALLRQLSWTHFLALIYLPDPLQRDFYAEMCRVERWSTRTLQQKIASMLYERTALSKKPDEIIREELRQLRNSDRISPDLVFRDPYVLDFLGLKDRYLERDLEDAILRELERFLLELGSGFAFLSRQKRIQINNDDYYIDLLFYHRELNRLIAVDLKLGDFKAEYVVYLRLEMDAKELEYGG